MIEHNVAQGSPEWLTLRAQYFTASEAPAAMGCSPYMTRTELLHQKHTGLVPDVASGTQRIFDKGHAAEAAARPLAEAMIGDDLYPVTGSMEVDGLPLLASFDGLTMDGGTVWEHKLWNVDAAQHIDIHSEPPIHHVWQLEQQLLVAGAERAVFTTSDGTQNNCCHCEYTSVPERRAALIAGWKQFAADLATYVPSIAVAEPVKKAVAHLPVVFDMRVEGRVLACNLDQFKPAVLGYIADINTNLVTDQDFADAEVDAKFCRDTAAKLKLAVEQGIAQMGDINTVIAAVREIEGALNAKGLALEKLVKAEKENRRNAIVQEAIKALSAHATALNLRIGKPLMPSINADFAGALKGKRNLDSMQDAVDTELARAKIQANEAADRIQINLRSIEATELPLLFADLGALVHKAPDDLAAVIDNRVAKFRADEAAREAAKAAIAQAQAPAPAPVATAQPAPMVAAPAPAPAPAAQGGPLIKLGEINSRIGPLSISAAGLAELGFEPAKQDGASKLYRAADFGRMCHAMAQRLTAVALPA